MPTNQDNRSDPPSRNRWGLSPSPAEMGTPRRWGQTPSLTTGAIRGIVENMPRRPRNATGGITYHVLNRAVGRRQIFVEDTDYAAFEKALAEGVTRYGTPLFAWCIMPNHF